MVKSNEYYQLVLQLPIGTSSTNWSLLMMKLVPYCRRRCWWKLRRRLTGKNSPSMQCWHISPPPFGVLTVLFGRNRSRRCWWNSPLLQSKIFEAFSNLLLCWAFFRQTRFVSVKLSGFFWPFFTSRPSHPRLRMVWKWSGEAVAEAFAAAVLLKRRSSTFWLLNFSNEERSNYRRHFNFIIELYLVTYSGFLGFIWLFITQSQSQKCCFVPSICFDFLSGKF
jgi:hypothetical protein